MVYRNSGRAGLQKAVIALAGVALFSAALAVLASGHSNQAKDQDQGLVQIDPQYVCMVNNQRFEKTLIPVKVEDRTYYGCCDMCADKLKNDPKTRVATDPVSGKQVDKSKAVIGAASDGKVYYFENAKNLKKFRASEKAETK